MTQLTQQGLLNRLAYLRRSLSDAMEVTEKDSFDLAMLSNALHGIANQLSELATQIQELNPATKGVEKEIEELMNLTLTERTVT